MQLNKIYNENCIDTMSRMDDDFIDLTVTSPPYDMQRTYKGFDFDINEVAKELFRVTKKGGVVVYVIGDQTINGSESGTSFKHALKFMEYGFNLHDTMIYEKDSISFPEKNRYSQIFEYMFVFSKGKPKTANIIKDRKNKWYGTKIITGRERQKNGSLSSKRKGNKLKEFGSRYNIWRISQGANKSSKDKIAFNHPAIFPEKLAADHIKTWSNKEDLIYDCFMGSGTTAKMSILLDRTWIGSEISKYYTSITEKRIDKYQRQLNLFR